MDGVGCEAVECEVVEVEVVDVGAEARAFNASHV